jgi:hypothetical protein
MDNERSYFLRKADTHLRGETESRDWLKSVPRVVGLDRPLQGMSNKTTAKRPRNDKPPTAPEAA